MLPILRDYSMLMLSQLINWIMCVQERLSVIVCHKAGLRSNKILADLSLTTKLKQ